MENASYTQRDLDLDNSHERIERLREIMNNIHVDSVDETSMNETECRNIENRLRLGLKHFHNHLVSTYNLWRKHPHFKMSALPEKLESYEMSEEITFEEAINLLLRVILRGCNLSIDSGEIHLLIY